MDTVELHSAVKDSAEKEILRLAKEYGINIAHAYLGFKMDTWGRIEVSYSEPLPVWLDNEKLEEAKDKIAARINEELERIADNINKKAIKSIADNITWRLEDKIKKKFFDTYKEVLEERTKNEIHKIAETTAIEIANRLKQ